MHLFGQRSRNRDCVEARRGEARKSRVLIFSCIMHSSKWSRPISNKSKLRAQRGVNMVKADIPQA